MYGSREDELAMLKLQQKVEDILKNNMDELVKRKNLMTGITPIVINKFDPEEHRVDIINKLKTIIKQTPDNGEVTKAFLYLKESNTIEEFYKIYDYFKLHLRYKRNLDFNQFKTEWDSFYSTLLKGDALNKPLLLKDVDAETQKEYLDLFNSLQNNKEEVLNDPEYVPVLPRLPPKQEVSTSSSSIPFKERLDKIEENIKQAKEKNQKRKEIYKRMNEN